MNEVELDIDLIIVDLLWYQISTLLFIQTHMAQGKYRNWGYTGKLTTFEQDYLPTPTIHIGERKDQTS
jgi:hypothetical protein